MLHRDQSGWLLGNEYSVMERSNVAVIGSGVSGLGAAWALARRHDVTLYEARDRLGGHAATVDVEVAGRPVSVDTGFIVYNEAAYPHLTRLFATLGVATEASDMSFSFSDRAGLEYAGSVGGMLGVPRNLVSRRYRSMIGDILRFRSLGYDLLETADRLTLGTALRAGGLGDGFIEDYLVPMTAAIWSARTDEILDYPASTMLRFLDNHGLIDITGRPAWRTVSGGSRMYVDKIGARLPDVRLGLPVRHIDRSGGAVVVRTDAGDDVYDEVVIAAHSDQALRMLGDGATAAERETLGALRYEPNAVVLHTDASLMPRRRRLWSSWNYLTDSDAPDPKASVTYWMNRLQNLATEEPLLVSLNPLEEPDPTKVLGRYEYAHPQFDLAAVAAQGRMARIQGTHRTWFAGAYLGYGFHEDGLQAGFNVAAALGSPPPWYDEVTPRSSAPVVASVTRR